MRNKKQKVQAPGNVSLLLGIASVTLYFNSKIQDPFNSPKFWILTILSMWSVGYLLLNFKKLKEDSVNQKISIIVLIFIVGMFVAATVTDDKYTAFFGENQRRNGFLTYLGLSIIFLTVVVNFKKSSYRAIYLTSLFTGFALGVYGLLQTFGMDFVQWNNPYNSVISTVGNPNFAAAIMAIIAVLNLGPIFDPKINIFMRFTFGFSVLLSLFVIYRSDARQGIIAFIVGFATFFGIWLHSKNKKLGWIIFGLSFIGLIVGILGMLQIGPLKELLYKPSVSVRGFYWRAGLAMFRDNPFFGIGIDRYGSYFKEYREKQYSLNYGFDITSTNAHNTPIQLLATGGFLVGFAYLALVLAIAYIGIRGLVVKKDDERLILASCFSGWLAYQAQSLISIDNVGISIWGWFLGGLVVVFARNEINNKGPVASNRTSIQPLISGSLAILALILVFTLYRSEANMFQTRMRYNPDAEANAVPLKEYAEKTINTPLVEPYYKFTSATYLITSGYVEEGMQVLRNLYAADPRDLDILRSLGEYELQLGNVDEAIEYFSKISNLDQWNANNYLRLGQLYKKNEDYSNMEQMRNKILSFATETEAGKSAIIELVKP